PGSVSVQCTTHLCGNGFRSFHRNHTGVNLAARCNTPASSAWQASSAGKRRVVLSLIRVQPRSDANEGQNVTCTGYTDELATLSKEVLMDTMAVTEFLARSTTLTSVGWIGYIIIGAIAGWVAKHLMHVKESFVVTILVGIAGALIGGFILSFF